MNNVSILIGQKQSRDQKESKWLVYFKRTTRRYHSVHYFGIKILVDPWLHVKADYMYDCAQNMFCMAKLSMSCGYTKGVSVDVLYL